LLSFFTTVMWLLYEVLRKMQFMLRAVAKTHFMNAGSAARFVLTLAQRGYTIIH
jgi:hypothetical protein